MLCLRCSTRPGFSVPASCSWRMFMAFAKPSVQNWCWPRCSMHLASMICVIGYTLPNFFPTHSSPFVKLYTAHYAMPMCLALLTPRRPHVSLPTVTFTCDSCRSSISCSPQCMLALLMRG